MRPLLVDQDYSRGKGWVQSKKVAGALLLPSEKATYGPWFMITILPMICYVYFFGNGLVPVSRSLGAMFSSTNRLTWLSLTQNTCSWYTLEQMSEFAPRLHLFSG